MRRIRALGKNRIASSSSIKCSVSRVWPLVGTFTKQSSSDQYFSSFGCKRTKSFACARLWTGNFGCKVSTLDIVGFCLDLNLFRSNASGLAIGVVASSPFSSGTSLSSGFFVASSDILSSSDLVDVTEGLRGRTAKQGFANTDDVEAGENEFRGLV